MARVNNRVNQPPVVLVEAAAKRLQLAVKRRKRFAGAPPASDARPPTPADNRLTDNSGALLGTVAHERLFLTIAEPNNSGRSLSRSVLFICLKGRAFLFSIAATEPMQNSILLQLYPEIQFIIQFRTRKSRISNTKKSA